MLPAQGSPRLRARLRSLPLARLPAQMCAHHNMATASGRSGSPQAFVSASNSPRASAVLAASAIAHMSSAAAAAVAVSASSATFRSGGAASASASGSHRPTSQTAKQSSREATDGEFKIDAAIAPHLSIYVWSTTNHFAFARLKQTVAAVKWAFKGALS